MRTPFNCLLRLFINGFQTRKLTYYIVPASYSGLIPITVRVKVPPLAVLMVVPIEFPKAPLTACMEHVDLMVIHSPQSRHRLVLRSENNS